MMKRLIAISAAVALVALSILGCAGTPDANTGASGKESAQASAQLDAAPLKLTILHVNDTHAKLESAYSEFKVDIDDSLKGKRTFVELGGFARLWAAVDALRAENPNTIFVHSGDVFQGTLYFTQFHGQADRDFLNAMGLDAMTLGNHEFDKGPATLVDFAEGAKFPIVCCNLDMTAEPALAAVVKPYVIKDIGGSRVAIVGVDTPDTPYISSPGPNVKFLDPAESLAKVVKTLESQGLNKIIVLSHIGYEADKELAAKVAGIDVIIGGHSHTLLGPVASLGLKSLGDYPTVVHGVSGDPVLVATGWQWASEIGDLNVDFDAMGKITSFNGTPKLIAGKDKFRIYDLPDGTGKTKRVEFTRAADGTYAVKEYNGKAYADEPSATAKTGYLAALNKLSTTFTSDSRFIFVDDKKEGLEKLATYSASINELKKKVATKAAEELKRANNKGPGPIIADSMLWKTGADIAIMNPGGVRVDMIAGDISVSQVYELQPFANTLVTIDLSGSEVLAALEDMADFCITSYTKTPETAYIYVSGVRMTLYVSAARGSRVKEVQVQAKDGSWKALDSAAQYKVVVNNFMAGGGDKNFTLEKVPSARKYDTGFIDSEVMLDYVMGKTLNNDLGERVKNVM